MGVLNSKSDIAKERIRNLAVRFEEIFKNVEKQGSETI